VTGGHETFIQPSLKGKSHGLLVDTEKNTERKAFLELAWHVRRKLIWCRSARRTLIGKRRRSLASAARPASRACFASALKWRRFSGACRQAARCSQILNFLFRRPRDAVCVTSERLGIRKRSNEAGIPSISLHSYRYAWEERGYEDENRQPRDVPRLDAVKGEPRNALRIVVPQDRS
jgi:hypothetical protein